MPKILVLYHSTYGHVEAMAEAVAEGARQVDGAEVDIKRVPELVPEELARKSGYKLDLAYFYLGKAAQGLGYDEAASIYLGKAEALSTQADSACAQGFLVDCQELDMTQASVEPGTVSH